MIIQMFILTVYLSFLIDFMVWPVSSEASTKNLILKQQDIKNSHKIVYLLIFGINIIYTMTPFVLSVLQLSADITRVIGFKEILGIGFVLTGRLVSLSGSRSLNINHDSRLLRHSIFKHSRNPVSLGLILTFLGLSIIYFHPLLVAGWIIFVLNLNYKINMEEKHLLKKYGKDYQDYLTTTPKYFLL